MFNRKKSLSTQEAMAVALTTYNYVKDQRHINTDIQEVFNTGSPMLVFDAKWYPFKLKDFEVYYFPRCEDLYNINTMPSSTTAGLSDLVQDMRNEAFKADQNLNAERFLEQCAILVCDHVKEGKIRAFSGATLEQFN